MDDVVRYRPRLWQKPWFVLLLPALVLTRVAAGHPLSAFSVALLALAVPLLLTQLIWVGRMGVDLHADGLVLRRIDQQFFPWREVRSVATTRRGLTESVSVEVRGYGFRLPAPRHTPFLSPDPEFAEKVRTIRTYWEQGRDA